MADILYWLAVGTTIAAFMGGLFRFFDWLEAIVDAIRDRVSSR